jgi:endonuclease/exonuclease/phosphatase family metal-dependent hydrolase
VVPTKPNVVRSVLVAVVSTLLVVAVGVIVTLSGDSMPGVSEPGGEQYLARAATAPDAPAPADSPETPAASSDASVEKLVRTVEKQVRKQPVRARTTTKDPAPAAPARNVDPTPAPYSFQLSAFNILGSNHTRPGGSARGYAPGRIRAEWAARLVTSRGLDIVGWSEIQADQYAAMMRATGGAFEGWPGYELGPKGIPASLMWRTSMFEAVWKGSVTIPFMGQQRPMPVVQLKERTTGREFFVMNVHNAPQGRQAERDAALDKELPLVRSLRKESGLPVFLIGDFNEKATLFCKVTSRTDLRAANGGSNNGSCSPPSGRLRVDWIFGSPDATMSGYRDEQGADVRRVTDHAMVWTDVTVN